METSSVWYYEWCFWKKWKLGENYQTRRSLQKLMASILQKIQDSIVQHHEMTILSIHKYLSRPSYDLVVSPLSACPGDVLIHERRAFQHDANVQKFLEDGSEKLWMHKCSYVKCEHPKVWKFIAPFVLAFPTSCTCESGLSRMANVKAKYRNRLNLAPPLRIALHKEKTGFDDLLTWISENRSQSNFSPVEETMAI